MKRARIIALAATVVGVALYVMWSWRAAPAGAPGAATARHVSPEARSVAELRVDSPPRARPPEPPAGRGLTAEEKAARIAKIKKDYDEIRAKASADYTAAGANFPGGLNAFLRQLALLEREKRADFAAVLSPQELEDLEMSETMAGQLVDRLLGPTHATVEQRKAVFRLQREFEDRYALTYDLTPRALLERETMRQQLQKTIHAVLGDELFSSWLYGEGEDYALFLAFAARHNLPPNAPLDLREIKNDFTLERLRLNAATGFTEEQKKVARAALAQQTEARVLALIGQNALAAGRKDLLSWLPKR